MIIEKSEIFSLLPNEEELENNQRDEYGRFLYKYSSRYNLYRDDLTKYHEKEKVRMKWPDGKSFALCLTHDVDHIKTYWKRVIRRLQGRASKGDYSGLIDGVKWYIVERVIPKYIFKHIIEVEKKYDATSTFFFMATEDWDKRYDISKYQTIIKYIEKQGYEIGLHPGMESHNNVKILRKEKERLERLLGSKVVGLRQHYLRFDPRSSWQNQIKAGFHYDCTYGYPDHVGFKNNCAHPFRPIDVNNKNELSILEIPLVIMDGTISDYMGCPFETHFEKGWEICKRVLDKVKQVGGGASIVWHSDQFNDCLYPLSGKFYERILQYGKEHNAWMTSGKNIHEYLINNNFK